MIGSLGDVVFETSDQRVQNFISLKCDTAVRYAEHEVINGKPKLEFLGKSLDSLSFSMELSVFRNNNPIQMIERLTSMMNSATITVFVIGNKNFGRFVIQSLSSSYDVITNTGSVLSAKVDISLKEYN